MADTVRSVSELITLLADSAAAHSTNRQLIRDIVVSLDSIARSAIVPPTGFGWIPAVPIYRSDSGVVTTADLSDYAPRGKTYYVNYTGSSDSNDGLTPATSFSSLSKALSMADVDVIRLNPILFTRSRSGFSTVPRSCSIIGDGGMATLTTHDVNTWSLDTGVTYKATVTSAPLSVWDSKTLDANGDYVKLTPVASIAAVNALAGSWFYTGTTLYVRTADSRVADADVRAYRNVTLAKIDTGVTVYFENINFEGDQIDIRNGGGAISAPTVYAKNCNFKYAPDDDSVHVSGATVYFQNCVAARGFNDGFSYHAFNGVLARSVEINCTGRDNGTSGTHVNNGTTSHDGSYAVRLNGNYTRNDGPNVADVLAAQSWNVACSASAGTAVTNGANYYVEGETWLDRCTSSLRLTYDYQLAAAAHLHVHLGFPGPTGGQTSIGAGAVLDSY